MDAEKLLEELVVDEGLRLTPYRCTAGRLTIGVGLNLDAGITREEALALARMRAARVAAELEARLFWWHELDPVRQRVLVNMAYNLGVDGLLEFHRTLACVSHGNWAGAAAGMLASKWATQVGERAQRLARMMATGRDA